MFSNNVRKFVSLLLALAMMLSLFTVAPLTAFAEGEATPTDLGGTEPTMYSVTWISYDLDDDDGLVSYVIKSESYAEGSDITGEYPNVHQALYGDRWTYSFDGWDKWVTELTGNVTITADYSDKTPTTYPVTWFWKYYDEGSQQVMEKSETSWEEYGTTFDGKTAPNFNAGDKTYTFAGWTPGLSPVSQDSTYVATYNVTDRICQITWKDGEKTVDTTTVSYGGTPSHAAITRDPTNTTIYTFLGWNPEPAAVYANTEYQAVFKEDPRMYTITWVTKSIVDGAIQENSTSRQFTYDAPLTGEFPAVEETLMTDTKVYTFTGWSPESRPVDGDLTYVATYSEAPRTCKITWVVDGVSEYVDVTKGEMPTHDNPTKDPTNDTIYTFVGWEPEIVAADGDATYTAVFNSTPRKYEVTFSYLSGDLTSDTASEASSTASFTYDAEMSAPSVGDFETAGHTYKFVGWEPELPATVKAGATYTAKYEVTAKKFTVTFKRLAPVENSDEVQETTSGDSFEYGATLSETVASDFETAGHVYKFTGWSPELAPVTAEATYTAQYEITTKKFPITFKILVPIKDSDETQEAVSTTDFEYGATLPEKECGDFDTAGHHYKFVGWEPELAPVTKAATYTAKYEVSVRMFTVTWVTTEQDDEGKLFEVRTDKTFEYGASLEGEFPAVQAIFYTNAEIYTFARWSPEPATAVTGNQTYTAEYSSEPREYEVSWYDDAGKLIDKTMVAYGKTPKHANPEKTPTDQAVYVFMGWTPEIVPVTGDASYTATFTSRLRTYSVKWLLDDGETVLEEQDVSYGMMPEYTGNMPTKAATKEYTYTFEGWDPEIVPVTEDAEYTAVFTAKAVPKPERPLTVPERSAKMNNKFRVYYGETPDPKQPEPALVVEWGRVSGAATYEIYVGYLEDGIPTTPRVTLNYGAYAAYIPDFNDQKVDPERTFVAFVVAKNRKGEEIGRTAIAYVAGPDAEYTNPEKLTVTSEKSIKLEVGQSSMISAGVSLEDDAKAQIPNEYVAEFRFMSTNENVATVSDSGEIVAVGRGTCIIQVYSKNALVEEIKVTVRK